MKNTFILHGDYSPINFIFEGVVQPKKGMVKTILFETKRKPKLQLLLSLLGLSRFFTQCFFSQQTLAALKMVQSGDRIILIEDRHRPILHALKSILPPGVECNLFLHTPVPHTRKNALRLREKSKLFYLSSFDEDIRAMLPTINIESSFYRIVSPSAMPAINSPIVYDCFFIGLEKGRGNILDEIRQVLDEKGLTHQFIITKDGKNFIPYTQTLAMMQKSRCIIDVTLSTKGMSLRPMESLYFQKKLITNSVNIINEKLYHPQNVFIWGKDDNNKLYDFIHSPFYNYSDDILSYYDINSWLERYGKKRD